MKIDTVNKTQKALQNIKNSVELEVCVLPLAEKLEYQEYFDKIEQAISEVQDKFHKDWIYNNQVKKNGY